MAPSEVRGGILSPLNRPGKSEYEDSEFVEHLERKGLMVVNYDSWAELNAQVNQEGVQE